MTSYDVIVVGLGAMGSATLYQLAQRGVNVLGIDQFDPPHHQGSTHGESRVTRLAAGEGPQYIPLVQRTHEIWRELEEKTGAPLLYESGCYVISPTIASLGWREESNFAADSARLAAQYKIPHELLDAAEVRRRHPIIGIEDGYHAYYEPSGGIVDPEQSIRVQLQLAKKFGATIQVNERVTSFKAEKAGVTVTTNQQQCQADKVILTTGPWIKQLLPETSHPSFGIYRQVMYWFEAEDPAQFEVSHFPMLMWIGQTQTDFFAAFPTVPGNQPGIKLLTEQFVETCDPKTVNREVSPAEIEQFADMFVSQKLRGLTKNCLRADVCLYTMTPDTHFIIDQHPDNEQILFASACSGHGFKHSAAIGEAIAQWAINGQSDIDLSKFSLSRF
ncbi:MAG: N-methyl-L-tryptophan oxidase [Chloroflexota bacterium]